MGKPDIALSPEPNSWQQLEPLVDQLLDAPPDERTALLDQLSGGDGARRAALQQLVSDCERGDRFLDRPAAERFAGLLEEVAAPIPELLAKRYRIMRELGRGGMAIVYLAQDVKHGREVAVKVVRPELSAALGHGRFLREIEIAAKLHHPHIVALYDSGEAEGIVYYVMPYEDGFTLRQQLARVGELPIVDAVRILRDVADAMAYAHRHGVVHRDIKPDNVLLTDRHALVADFGVAKAVNDATERQTVTTAGVALGTPAYMAPEQVAGDARADHRIDIYAFGVMAFEMLTGQPPFVRSSVQAVLSAHLAEPAPAVRQRRVSIPAPLAALVMKCLEKQPADRWQSADDLVRELEMLGTPELAPTRLAALRSRWMSKAVIAVGALVVASLGIAIWQRAGDPAELEAHRVAVVGFRNETGVDSLDTFGAILADMITTGLSRAAVVSVVPGGTIAASTRRDGRAIAVDPVALGRDTRAGLVVTGSYYLRADSLQVRPHIIEVGQATELVPIEPVTVPLVSQEAGILAVVDRVMVALSGSVDPRLGGVAALSDLPMSMPAYRELAAGVERYYARDYRLAVNHFTEALRLDSTSATAILWEAEAVWNDGANLRKVDSLLRIVERRKADLPPHDLARFEWLRAYLDGDLEAVLRVTRRHDELASGNAIVQATMRLNRLDEALSLMTKRIGTPINRKTTWSWMFLTQIRHMRGEHRRELRDARRGLAATRQTEPPSVTTALLEYEIRALAALGRMGELGPRLEALRALEPTSASFASAAGELRWHGHSAAATEVGGLAARWYREALARSPELRVRVLLAKTLFDVQQWDDARRMFEQLAAERSSAAFNEPTAIDDDLAGLGYLGIDAARRGDTTSADAMIRRLGTLDRPYLLGRNVHWQARIAARLGQCERAVGFLQESLRKGTSIYDQLRMESPEFAALQRCRAFRELAEPKG